MKIPEINDLSAFTGAPEFTAPQEKLRNESRSEWNKIAEQVPEGAREIAEEFIELCENTGALGCKSGCTIDDIGKDGIIFDWNDGELPVLSVMIGPGSEVVYSARFKDGNRISGTDSHLEFVKPVLIRMIREWGNLRYKSPMHVLSSRVERRPHRVELNYSFHQTEEARFQFLQPDAPQMTISRVQGYTSPAREIDQDSMGGISPMNPFIRGTD